MFAVYDNNPYPLDSRSSRIWERNKKMGTYDVHNASAKEKFIIYLYVMSGCIREVSRKSGLSETSVNSLITKYHIKLDS